MAGSLTISDLKVVLGGASVLQNVSLEIQTGWFGVLGVNGSGKTTLLRSLCGRLRVDGGDIRLGETEITQRPDQRAEWLLDAPPIETLPLDLTVGELLDLVEASRVAPRRSGEAIHEVLGVHKIAGRRIGTLSAGLKQRVAIALAFTGDAPVVLLDEPFNWLDPVTAYELKGQLKLFSQDRILITTLHDVGTFTTFCDAGVLLHCGRVARVYNAEELRAHRQNTVVFEEEIYRMLKAEATQG